MDISNMFRRKGVSKPQPLRITKHFLIKELLRTPDAPTDYDINSLMFLVHYPDKHRDEFLPYEELKDTEAWRLYCDRFLTPRIGTIIGKDHEGTEIITYSSSPAVDIKNAQYNARVKGDRKRSAMEMEFDEEPDENVNMHTPKKFRAGSTLSSISTVPSTVIKELRNRFEKHSTSENGDSGVASHVSSYSSPSFRSTKSYQPSMTSYNPPSGTATTGASFGKSFVPRGSVPPKKDKSGCSIV